MLELPGGDDSIDRIKAISVRSASAFTIYRKGNTTGLMLCFWLLCLGWDPFTDLRIYVSISMGHPWVDTWSQIYSTQMVIHCWDKLPGLAAALKVRSWGSNLGLLSITFRCAG